MRNNYPIFRVVLRLEYREGEAPAEPGAMARQEPRPPDKQLRTLVHCSNISLILILLGCLGCGSTPVETGPVGKVEGKVAYKAKAIKIGTVLIVSADGKFKSSGLISPEGTYVVENAPAGKVKVFLQFPELPESLKPNQAPPGVPALPKNAKPAHPELSPQEMELYQSISQLPRSITEYPGNYFQNLTVKEGETTSFNIVLKPQVPR